MAGTSKPELAVSINLTSWEQAIIKMRAVIN